MISRYTLPRMSAIWTEENKFRKMLAVEIAACEAMCKLGKVPREALQTIKTRARFDVEIEQPKRGKLRIAPAGETLDVEITPRCLPLPRPLDGDHHTA